MGEPSVQIATDFGDPRISVAGENGARDVCRESRSLSAIVDNSPQWSMQHDRRIVVEHALGDSVIAHEVADEEAAAIAEEDRTPGSGAGA